MNPDGTPIVEQEPNLEEPSTENISAADGGVGTTPDEVAELLNLPKPAVAADDEEVDEEAKAEAEKAEALKAEEAKAAEDAKLESDRLEKEKADEAAKLAAAGDADAPTFTLEIEDVNGEKITLNPDDDLEQALKDFEPKNNGQIFKILDDIHKLREDKAAYDQKQTADAAEAEKAEALSKINEGWDNEIKALQGDKRIPVSSDGKEDPRVKEVFDFMGKINDEREKDGRPPIRSFEDALDKLELQESKDAKIQKEKDEKDLAKKRGSVVGGSSAPATSGAPTYKGGARNANEAIRSLGLIK